MAKKKKEPEQSTFPKISSTAKIGEMKLKPGSQRFQFDDLSFSDNQISQLKPIMDEKEELMLTISPVQGRLPGTGG